MVKLVKCKNKKKTVTLKLYCRLHGNSDISSSTWSQRYYFFEDVVLLVKRRREHGDVMILEAMLTFLETVRLDKSPCHTYSWPQSVVFERCTPLFLDPDGTLWWERSGAERSRITERSWEADRPLDLVNTRSHVMCLSRDLYGRRANDNGCRRLG